MSQPIILPDLLEQEVQQFLQQFYERNPDYSEWLKQQLSNSAFKNGLFTTWSASAFAANFCIRTPQILQSLAESGRLFRANSDKEVHTILQADLSAEEWDENQFDQCLRINRNREMLRIIWRDINRLADLKETTADISALAEVSIQQALAFHHRRLAKIYGKPMAQQDGDWIEQKMIVLGMGKLGARELNLSSDIDLIFCFPYSGETQGAKPGEKKSLDNSEFFTRLARKLIHSLDNVTVDGFVFRVDMRLRPYGQSGPLVLSFDAMEEYYQDQGRDWERYAMIKARALTGKPEQCQALMDLLRPFTYRRYIDYSAVESLRSMKQMIRQEVKRRKLDSDVKLGAGGIREIEFIVQCFQLIRGGREFELQERRVLKALTVLAVNRYLPEESAWQLREAYIFLRNTEHAIQAYNDQQTQRLPTAEVPRQALAFAMGFSSWENFSQALATHRDGVNLEFRRVIANPDSNDEEKSVQQNKIDTQWSSFWLGYEHNSLGILLDAGHERAEDIVNRMQQLREDSHVQRMQPIGRERLDQFMPLLLAAVVEAEQPSETLLRILQLVEAVLRRTAYLVLLIENPKALKQLVVLCSASPWISKQLSKYPLLLDELLDARTLYHVPEKEALRDDLHQLVLRIPGDDLESHMEALRYFKLSHRLHVAAAEVTERLPLMRVSDYLTMIAEVILERVLDLAWDHLVAKHGRPRLAHGEKRDKGFIVVGYGKLGGIELGHGSDLDLVFIHDAASGLATDGDRPIDNGLFFTRLGQRMIHILTAQTASGMLYDVDMRLRPSGTSGLLVSSLNAFEQYQREQAWTWEHQALVRARVVAGDQDLALRFEALRKQLLCHSRDADKLRTEVAEMRQKMRDHLQPKGLETDKNPVFHLKHGNGAIVDIEFMVQYAVLVWSHQHPALAVYSDNIRILETLAQEGLFEGDEVDALTEAYKAYRSQAHRLSLQQQANEAPLANYEVHRQVVKKKWQELIG